MVKKVQKGIINNFLYSFEMAYKRRRTSRKGGCSKNKPTPSAVSLKSLKRKSVTTNYQIQKRLDSLLKGRSKFGKSQQEGGFIGAILLATVPLWLPLAVKGVKRYFTKNGKRICTEERQEYNQLQDNSTINVYSENDTAPGSSMLLIQQIISSG